MCDEDYDELISKKLCCKCIGEKYLSDEVNKNGRRLKCSYCGKTFRSLTLDKISEIIKTAINKYYARTPTEPDSLQYILTHDDDFDYEWEREGIPIDEVIRQSAQISYEIAEDIHSILSSNNSDFEAAKIGEETDFSSDSYYTEMGPNGAKLEKKWHSFEYKIKNKSRFFNKEAISFLHSIFNKVDEISTSNNQSLVVDAGPGLALSSIVRARVFMNLNKLEEAMCRPDKHLCSPPSDIATAGRMNAHGISVFYGSNNCKLAITEVRPPVGSKVLTASFNILRPIKLLNFPSFTAVFTTGSIFDPFYEHELERIGFIHSFVKKISKPILPNNANLEYIPTQAIADFLATENNPTLDGIIFPSSQKANIGLNIVLFHHACRVKEISFEKDTIIEANSYRFGAEGWEPVFYVSEKSISDNSIAKKDSQEECYHIPDIDGDDDDYLKETRDFTLEIDITSVKAHEIEHVDIKSFSHDVTRHRSNSSDKSSPF